MNHPDRPVLLFDDSCPMCQVYTGSFERLGWAGRHALGQSDGATLAALDLDRARHEIPLIDTHGQIRYGLDALTEVIGANEPMLGRIMRWRATRLFAQPLYWFISYNRREMAGCPPPETGFDCAPDFHRGWNAAYVATLIVTIAATLPTSAVTVAVATGGGAARFAGAAQQATLERRRQITAQALTSIACGAVVTRVAAASRFGVLGANAAGIAVATHQLWRRRFLRND